ncbi:MAG: avidin/streptavidin family protein [Xanthobacteraceae bacterium]
MKRLVTALVLIVATSVGAFAQSLPVPSYWLNQRGSEMKLYAITPSGDFTGVYFNKAAGFQCQYGPSNPVPYTVNGHARGNSVIFNVVWNNGIVNCNSKTVWFGTLQGRTLTTKWTLTGRGIPPMHGTDIFQQHW